MPDDPLRIDFLDSEFDLCNTFLDVAASEDDPQHANFAFTKAQEGYRTAAAFLKDLPDTYERARLTARLTELRTRLETMKSVKIEP